MHTLWLPSVPPNIRVSENKHSSETERYLAAGRQPQETKHLFLTSFTSNHGVSFQIKLVPYSFWNHFVLTVSSLLLGERPRYSPHWAAPRWEKETEDFWWNQTKAHQLPLSFVDPVIARSCLVDSGFLSPSLERSLCVTLNTGRLWVRPAPSAGEMSPHSKMRPFQGSSHLHQLHTRISFNSLAMHYWKK